MRAVLLRMREDDPGHSKFGFETLEIRGLKILPSALCLHFFEPARSQAGNAGGHATIFLIVGERATLGEGAESMIILARQRHVVGIEREQAVDRSVLPNPGKSLQPCVLPR